MFVKKEKIGIKNNKYYSVFDEDQHDNLEMKSLKRRQITFNLFTVISGCILLIFIILFGVMLYLNLTTPEVVYYVIFYLSIGAIVYCACPCFLVCCCLAFFHKIIIINKHN